MFSISGDNVQLSIEDDGEATKTVDISTTTAVTANSGKTTESTTAGRSLTLSTYAVSADAELYTFSKTLYFEDPVATDDFLTIWYTKLPVTITNIYAESDQTVTFNLQRDDGSPADIATADLAPAAGSQDACASGCTTTLVGAEDNIAANERIDLKVTSVANTPTWVSITFTGTYDD